MSLFTVEQLAAATRQSIAQAARALQGHKNNFMNGHVGKATRPWFIVDFPSLHPNDATLVGFEIETGFRSAEARTDFMSWLWDNTDYVTVDREGCSNCPTEITFPPMPFDTLLGDDSPITLMFERSASLPTEQQLATTRVTGSDARGGCVGTHTNVSTAAFRSTDNNRRAAVVTHLQQFFHSLTNEQRYALQGRAAYTAGVAQVRGGTGDGALRIEFKMFHTTTSTVQFRNYLLVSQRLAQLIDGLVANSQHAVSVVRNTTMCLAFLLQDVEGRNVIVHGNPQYTASIISAATAVGRQLTASVPDPSVLRVAA